MTNLINIHIIGKFIPHNQALQVMKSYSLFQRRVESASGADDASSFYKRLGLDILAPSPTFDLSQQVSDFVLF